MSNLFRCGTYVEKSPVLSLYHWGDECVDITGGWGIDGYSCSATYTPSIGTKEEEGLLVKGATNQYNMFGTLNPIDVTDYKFLEVVYSYSAVASSSGLSIFAVPDKTIVTANITAQDITGAKTEATNLLYTTRLDISELTGDHYIAFGVHASTSRSARVRSVMLVK